MERVKRPPPPTNTAVITDQVNNIVVGGDIVFTISSVDLFFGDDFTKFLESLLENFVRLVVVPVWRESLLNDDDQLQQVRLIDRTQRLQHLHLRSILA